ncbi:MAG: hypothetical protein AAFN70_04735, partial [Planctomycetota bacterium]
MALPQQIIPSDAPPTRPTITVSTGDIGNVTTSSQLTTNMVGGAGNWPTFEFLTRNFSLADSMAGFRLGFHDLIGHVDQIVDTTLLGRDLPLVGGQLAGASEFLLQIRDSVTDNLGLYGSSLTVENVAQGFYDALGPGGYDWLQDDPATGDGIVNFNDVKVVRDTVTVDGQTLVIGVQYELDLQTPVDRLATPVDLDLLLPGLGLDLDAEVDVNMGYKFPLRVGVSIADGVYIDVSGTNDLEIKLDAALPGQTSRMTAGSRVTFDNSNGTAPTITRHAGNWVLDGFRSGQIIQIDDSTSNDGRYIIGSIDPSGRVLTLRSTDANLAATSSSQDRIVSEGPTAGVEISVRQRSVTGNPSLQFQNVQQSHGGSTYEDLDAIVRSSGSWTKDGFSPGDIITITGTSNNNGQYRVFDISANGRALTVETVLHPETTSDALIIRQQENTIDGRLGILPIRAQQIDSLGQPSDDSLMTGTFVIDLEPGGSVGPQRLTLGETIAASPMPVEPVDGFTSNPLPALIAVTDNAADPLTVQPLSLQLRTDLPRSAAYPPYRMRLDIGNWNWAINDSLVDATTNPTLAFNDVQFDVVGFMRDFVGPQITRMSEALEAADDILRFLESEAMPILSLLFGRTSYASAAGTFGGNAQAGNFTGAAIAIRALANGGEPFERDALTEFLSDLINNREFDDISLSPITSLSGETWIDIGNFGVNADVALGGRGRLFDPVANKETDLGGFSDKSLRLTGQAQLTFQQNQIQRFDLQRSATVSITPIVLTSQIAINIPGSASWDIAEGDRVTISGTGLIDGTHKILDRLGDQILISHPN